LTPFSVYCGAETMRQSVSPIILPQKGFDWWKKWKRFQTRTRFLRPFSSRRGVTGHRGTWGTPQKISMCDILKKTNNGKGIHLLGAYCCLCSNCVRLANFSLNYSTLNKTLLLVVTSKCPTSISDVQLQHWCIWITGRNILQWNRQMKQDGGQKTDQDGEVFLAFYDSWA
jgi:hypothetical protein